MFDESFRCYLLYELKYRSEHWAPAKAGAQVLRNSFTTASQLHTQLHSHWGSSSCGTLLLIPLRGAAVISEIYVICLYIY